jgi:tetratricopeptide (TPR) repeat protein
MTHDSLSDHIDALQALRQQPRPAAAERLAAAEAALADQPEAALSPALRFELGSVYLSQGQWQQAQAHLLAASQSLPARGGAIYHRLGRAAQELGQTEQARQAYQQALTYKVRTDDPKSAQSAGKTWHQLGRIQEQLAAPEEAIEAYRQAIRCFERADQALEQGISAFHLGRLQQQGKAWETAREAFETARHQLVAQADLRAQACYCLGEIAIQLEQPELAEARLNEALSIQRHLKHRAGTGMTLLKLCQALMLQRKWKDVISTVRQAIEALEGTEEKQALKLACELQGELLQLLGKADEAQPWFTRAESL